MTVTIEIAPEVRRRLESKAQRDGRTLAEYLGRLAEREAQQTEESATPLADEQANDIARRLAALDSIPAYRTREGLPELDLSGSRADVYGYTEREDAQL